MLCLIQVVGLREGELTQVLGNSLPAADLPQPARRLITAAGVSAIGDGLTEVGLGLLAVSLTRDPALVTGVLVASRAPWLVLGASLSRRVDRHPRPAEWMFRADVVRFGALLITALLVLRGDATIGLLYATAFVTGTGEIVHTAAANNLLPEIARGQQLSKANGYIGAAQTAGYAMTGPAIAGAVYGTSRSIPFFADAASFAASCALLRPLRRIEIDRPDTTHRAGLAAPFAATMNHPLLRVLLVQFAVLGMTQAMVLSILPLYGREWLALGAGLYGVFLGGTAVGNVVGGLWAPRLWAARRYTASFVVGCGLVAGAAYVAASRTQNPWVAVVVLAIEALAVGVMNTISPTLRMEQAPSALRGQVSTLFRQVIYVTAPVGAVLSGLLARRYGIDVSLATAGALVIATMLLTDGPLRRAVRTVGA